MATIQDVAKAAGVSAMTVSNVINDHPNVRRATREKVLEAMARLDYRVNLAARNLRKGRTGTIGLAIPGSTVRTTASWLPPSSPRPCGTTCG